MGWHGTGQRTQNFVHVSDVVNALLLAAEAATPGVYNIGGSASISMKELARLVVELTPKCHSRVGANGISDGQEGYRWDVDLSKSKTDLNYSPGMPLKKGLKEYIETVRDGTQETKWWRNA